MGYMLWMGKFGVCLFWFGVLMAWNAPMPKPFPMLLGSLAMGVLVAHLLMLILLNLRVKRRRHACSDSLQILLFGAFHLQSLNSEPDQTTVAP